MIYGEQDLDTQERNAWQRGDYVLAEALAVAIDAEEQLTAQKEAEEDVQSNYDRAQEAWSDMNTEMRHHLEELRQVVESAARVSDRDLILERIADAEALIDKAEEGGQ